MRSYLILAALASTLLAVVYATAGEENVRFHDRQRFLVQTGTTDVDVSASDYTSFVTLLTMEPNDSQVMHDVLVVFDLDKATTGFSDVVSNGITMEFAVARKVDGTNYRTDIAQVSTAINPANTDGSSFTLDLGTVTPTEDARIMVRVGSEQDGDFELPYAVTYRSGASATFTDVAN